MPRLRQTMEKLRIEFRAAFPKLNRFRVPAAVVKQIAEIIRRAGVVRIGAHGGFENGNFFQARRKTIIRR